MQPTYSAEADAYREKVQAFLAEHLPPDWGGTGTLEGEPTEIYQYLGSQRLSEPIDRFDHVKAVVHGHAHHGTYEGRTPLGKPVYNVAQFVLRPLFGRPYALIEV